MGEIFGTIYCWFEDLFGIPLGDYMWGTNYQPGNKFITVGFITIAISFAIAAIFYYVINHPKANNFRWWLVPLAVNAIINFIWAWQYTKNDYLDGLMSVYNEAGELVPMEGIYESSCVAFGFANAILSILFFFLATILIKWKSSNCSRAPF